MDMKLRIAKNLSFVLAFVLVATSCKKLDRPSLGDYPTDEQNLPAGDLRFYTPFDFTSPEFRFQVQDSISTNPSFFDPSPMTSIPGVRGSGVKGSDANAIQYLNANDFGTTGSFSISFWLKNSAPNAGKPEFAFSVANKDYWANSTMFMLLEHTNGGTTADLALVKFYVVDTKGEKWFELVGGDRIPGILDNQWHHLVFAYNGTTSDMQFFKDGALHRTINWAGHGAFQITPASMGNFILGGFNKHAGVAGPTDDWMQSWQGGLDQFRLYNKTLSPAEVQTLFSSKS